MSWDAEDVALLKQLWACGHSAGQIATRLGHSRNAVCAKLKRSGLKRGRKPPTAKPRIFSASKRPQRAVAPQPNPSRLAACARPEDKVVSPRNRRPTQPQEFTKRQLYEMLADAVRNTG